MENAPAEGKRGVAPHGEGTSPFDRLRARGLLGQILLASAVIIAALLGMSRTLRQPGYTGAGAVMVYVGILIVLFIRAHGVKLDWRKLMGRPAELADLPLLGVVIPLALITIGAMYLVFVPISYVEPELVERIVNDSTMFDVKTPLQFAVLVFAMVVAAPVVEEILFRGFLLHRWARRWGTPAGVVVSSIAFAIGHAEWLGHFLTGMVFALLYLRTRSLWVPMLAHALNNLLAAVPMAWTFFTHEKEAHTALGEFRGDLGVGVVTFAGGVLLLWMYRDLYWPGDTPARAFSGAAPYDAAAGEPPSTSLS